MATTAAVAVASCTLAKAKRKPNVIFFIADDMRPKHFNCLPQGKGKNLTPNIDKLWKEGTVMLEQHCASPICTPSRFNVLTGRYASRAQNGWFKGEMKKNGGQSYVEFNTKITLKDDTLGKMLQRAGYTTGMVGKDHVFEVKDIKKIPDFDSSATDPKNVSILKANHDHACQVIRESGFDYVDRVYINNPDFLGLHEVAVQNMDWITEGGVKFIEQDHKDAPFFLYFATTVPHGPTEEKRSWNADPKTCAIGILDKAPNVQPPRHTIPTRLKDAGLPVNDDTTNMLWLDDAVGALLDKLEATGQLDNTVIIFYSDHGQNAKGTVYQGGVHNPCIIWRKGGFPCGPTNKSLTHIVDFAPTILDIAGADASNIDFDGESFLPYLEGKKQDEGRIMYFELGYARGIRKGNFKYMAVRYPDHIANMSMEERKRVLDEWNADRRRKHIEIVTEDHTKPFSHLTAVPGGGHAEVESTGLVDGYFDPDQLYDLSRDPGEEKNLAKDPEYKQKLEEMQQEMRKILATLPGKFEV